MAADGANKRYLPNADLGSGAACILSRNRLSVYNAFGVERIEKEGGRTMQGTNMVVKAGFKSESTDESV